VRQGRICFGGEYCLPPIKNFMPGGMDVLLEKERADHLKMLAGKGCRRPAQRIVTLLSLGVNRSPSLWSNCLPLQQH
jgi:hypothetical protein